MRNRAGIKFMYKPYNALSTLQAQVSHFLPRRTNLESDCFQHSIYFSNTKSKKYLNDIFLCLCGMHDILVLVLYHVLRTNLWYINGHSAASCLATGYHVLRTNLWYIKEELMIQTLYNVPEYREELLYPAISKAMETLKITDDLRPDMKVVLKPNLIAAKNPSYPVTTHPAVIGAVVRWLKEQGITDITLAESSGGVYTAEYMKHIYKVCGMTQLEPDLRLNMDFSSRTVFCPEGFANPSFQLLTPICEADYIINICKLKTHSMTGYSGGIKNLFGTIPGLQKPQMHYRWPDLEEFSRMLLELAQMVKPQLTIIDGIEAMEGNGPTGGSMYPLHLLFAARDFYTQDYFAAKVMGMNPMDIAMIRQAAEQGLVKPDEIQVSGDNVPEGLAAFLMPDTKKLDFTGHFPAFLKKPLAKIASALLKSYPRLITGKCVGCGKCAESCPAKVIRIKNGKAQFGRKGCISCFCCQEMCPAKAIAVKKAF